MKMRSHTLIALVAGAAIGFSGALATNVLAQRAVDGSAESADGASSLPWEDAHLFAEVFNRIKRDYVDSQGDHKLVENAIRGMVSSLDAHSAYLDSEEFDEIRLSTMGTYPGVGIEVAADSSSVKILHAISGSPAELAGIRSGDQIVRIDGQEIGGDLAGAIAHMRGASGSLVRLSVRRESVSQLLEYALRRAQVEVHSV